MHGSRSCAAAVQLDVGAMPGRGGEPRVAGDERDVKRFGERVVRDGAE